MGIGKKGMDNYFSYEIKIIHEELFSLTSHLLHKDYFQMIKLPGVLVWLS
jgi:hypothetical protein